MKSEKRQWLAQPHLHLRKAAGEQSRATTATRETSAAAAAAEFRASLALVRRAMAELAAKQRKAADASC